MSELDDTISDRLGPLLSDGERGWVVTDVPFDVTEIPTQPLESPEAAAQPTRDIEQLPTVLDPTLPGTPADQQPTWRPEPTERNAD